ncbi:MAG: hypothetical protein MI924_04150, partial [Chloroflexales bacterium]|nr:hypothetical protein [Chloroflexales bacterium]
PGGPTHTYVGDWSSASVSYSVGDVVSYGGAINLDDTAKVEGNVMALAGTVNQGASGVVAGELIQGGAIGGGAVASVNRVFIELQAGNGGRMSSLALSLGLALVTLALTLVSVAFWPHRTIGAGRTLLAMPGRALTMGLLTTLILAALMLLLTLVLAITLIGLPLVVIVLLLIQLPYIYGLAALAQALGSRLERSASPGVAIRSTALGIVALLLPIIIVSAFSLALGAVLFYVLASAGLGAVILSRGGAFAPAL